MNHRRIGNAAATAALMILMAAPAGAGEPAGNAPLPETVRVQRAEALEAAADAAPAPWMTVAASGRVSRRDADAPEDAWRKVRRGDTLAPMTHVRADARGRATLTRDGDIVLVSPGSLVTLPGGVSSSVETIRHDSGSALYQVKPGREGRFEVVTPLLVAGVKGTQFSVFVRDGYAAVEVVEGHVEVQSLVRPGESVDLFAGDMVTMDGRDGRMEVRSDERREVIAGDDATRRAIEVRDDTKRLTRDLSIETSMFDFETLWKERMSEMLMERDSTLSKDADRMFEDKGLQKTLDDARKGASTGTVNSPD